MKVKIKILLFGMLTDMAGKAFVEIEFANNIDVNTDTLMKKVIELYPEFRKVNFIIAVNKKVISENQLITVDDEVALLPPFAGG